jgi:hypothetical protein
MISSFSQILDDFKNTFNFLVAVPGCIADLLVERILSKYMAPAGGACNGSFQLDFTI